MPSHHDELTYVAGDEWEIIGALLDENGDPLSLDGVDLAWTLIGPNGLAVPQIVAGSLEKDDDLATGKIYVTVPASATRQLFAGRYRDSVRVSIGGAPATMWTGTILVDANPFDPLGPVQI